LNFTNGANPEISKYYFAKIYAATSWPQLLLDHTLDQNSEFDRISLT